MAKLQVLFGDVKEFDTFEGRRHCRTGDKFKVFRKTTPTTKSVTLSDKSTIQMPKLLDHNKLQIMAILGSDTMVQPFNTLIDAAIISFATVQLQKMLAIFAQSQEGIELNI